MLLLIWLSYEPGYCHFYDCFVFAGVAVFCFCWYCCHHHVLLIVVGGAVHMRWSVCVCVCVSVCVCVCMCVCV